MKIILIRHGESEGNVAHLINDDPSRPVNLTERGRAQAEAAANGLREMRFHACLCFRISACATDCRDPVAPPCLAAAASMRA